ncbi:uncharacterized protein LOC132719444 isoform X2 [Ruditapes philippinarum]|uniref:uncharacterized protein LOC132719444 isoform X2 n=1 Tax=Ruditapes philippinarum TaxID=129788 RepID=UPI00295A7C82|nr:uncharacterized protein LOC132719444 isoform X2 [Ruditapes philippinarum]
MIEIKRYFQQMTTEFKVKLRLVEKKSGEVVSYKQDGERFGQAVTVKLTTDTEYEISVSTRPAIIIERLMINGESQTLLDHIAGGNRDDSDSKTYIIHYSTIGYDVSKGGSRKNIPFTLEDGKTMKTSLQCKLYRTGEKSHSHWGQTLSAIDIDCKAEEGRSYITVTREKYL